MFFRTPIMKYITRPPGLFIGIVFLTTITVATASTTAVAGASPPPPCPPQSASLPDPASTAAAINAATQALQATNITSQLAITSSKEMMEKNKAYYEGVAATNKSYYEDMTTKLLWAAGLFSLFVTAGGIGAVEITNRWRINRLARKAVANFKTLFDTHMDEARQFRTETDSI